MVVEEEVEEEEGYMPSLDKDDISSMIEHAMKNEDGEDIVDIREAWDDSLHVVPPLSRECEASLPAHNDQQQEKQQQDDEEEDILLDMILESNLRDDVEDKTTPTFAGFGKGFLLPRPRAAVVKEKEMTPQERPRAVDVVKEKEVRPSSLKQTNDSLERKPLSKFKQSRMKSIPSS